MTWIVTNSGIEFDLAEPTPGMIDLPDIAHALSRIRRFNGHTGVNCSVALHSVILSYAVTAPHARHALLHDAHEAYIGDISSPLKALLGRAVKDIERRIDAAISERVGIDLSPCSFVKNADLSHLKYEKETFLPPCDRPWPCLDGVRALRISDYLRSFYDINDPTLHAKLFLNRYYELEADA